MIKQVKTVMRFKDLARTAESVMYDVKKRLTRKGERRRKPLKKKRWIIDKFL